MSDLLLRLLAERISAPITKASGNNGGEYHSPCPLCGGTDRFVVFPEQSGGDLCQKHGITGTWACPRHCEKGGDVISFLMAVDGLSFSVACAELGIPLHDKDRDHRRAYRPLRQPRPAHSAAEFAPHAFQPPTDSWRIQATKLANEAHERLLQSPAMLRYLERRGLPEAAVRAYRLGYIEAEGNQTDCIFRARAAFGLPEKIGANGKPRRALRIPRGITIPVWAADSSCLRLRIRRRNVDLVNPKDPKYMLVPQPDQPYSAPLLLPPLSGSGCVPAALATWVVVESELDAMAVHHACAGKVGVLSVLTVRVKPDQAAHTALSQAARILVALDFDRDKPDGSNPGADAWPWWARAYPQARLWPVPEGKDPGEAHELGVNLREWVFMGLPFAPSSPSGELTTVKTETPPSVNGAMGASLVTPPAARETGKYWTPPDVGSLSELQLPTSGRVTMDMLLDAFRRHPLSDPICLVPCPRTRPSSFWWRYRKNCRRCNGHPLCLIGLIQSSQFQEALHASV